MEQERIVKNTLKYVEARLGGESSGHDLYHILRVRNTAIAIASTEKGADLFVVELSALLHDIADWKFNKGDIRAGPRVARKWLKGQNVPPDKIDKICTIIKEVTFKGAGVKTKPTSLEGRIVQDADRLDAIGAIGIARAFAYGGKAGRVMHDPAIKPKLYKSFRAYKQDKGTTINHFYQKLLLLKEKMNTKTGKRMASERHRFTEEFLGKFLEEWDGTRK